LGYSELPKTPFETATATRCGSLAKPITALCAFVLSDLGKLDIDAPIVPILKEAGIVPKPVGAGVIDSQIQKITSRHLMDHTSGFSSSTAYTAWRPGRNLIRRHGLNRVPTSADVACDALGNSRLDSDPGAKFQYANANFVLLARVIEAKTGQSFNEFLTRVAMPRFGVAADEIYVSRNQETIHGQARGKNEAAYYQTSAERYVSFLPADQSRGKMFGEAYRGYATECSDGAGGIACTAEGIGKIIANLHSDKPAISNWALLQILTPPDHYTHASGFDPGRSTYYSKGFNVRFSGGRPWYSHSGMTNHCGGVIGFNAGYQFVAVSNWNNTGQPYVDSILNRALTEAVGKI
jgi:CubicO group peptidase (beta-lactamase class C family)